MKISLALAITSLVIGLISHFVVRRLWDESEQMIFRLTSKYSQPLETINLVRLFAYFASIICFLVYIWGLIW